MTKRSFIRNLRRKLRFKYNQRTINGIVKDYDEYFEVGITQGETIEDMIKSIGPIEEIELDLREERDYYAPLKLMVKGMLSIIFIYFSYLYPFSMGSNFWIVVLNCIFILTGSLGIWWLIGGDFDHDKLKDLLKVYKKEKSYKTITIFTISWYVFSILFIITSAYYIIGNNRLPFGLSSENARNYVFILKHTFIPLIPMIILSYLVARKYYINTLPILLIAFSLLASVRALFYLYNNSLNVEILTHLKYFLMAMIPIAVGIVSSYFSYKWMERTSIDSNREIKI